MAANSKSSGKQGTGSAVTRELDQLRKKVKELTLKLESEMKARKLDARVAAEAKKARDQVNKQVKALSEQGRKMAAQLKSALGDSNKRQQALKEARDKVSELKAELTRKASDLKRRTEELTKIAAESAHRAVAVMRGEHEPTSAQAAPSEPPAAASASERSHEGSGEDQPKIS